MSARGRSQGPLSFSTRPASTGILSEDGSYVEKGEFELVFKAEVVPADQFRTKLKEGMWLCECTAKVGRQIHIRDILLGASSWDSTKNFKDNLREAFVGGTMCVDFTTPQLTAYYKHLKEQYRASGEHTLLLVEVLGRQPDSDYWVLNKNLHFENGTILSEDEYRYYLPSYSNLNMFACQFEPNCPPDLGEEIRQLIPLLAEAFSDNFFPVFGLISYAASALYKKDIEEYFDGLSTMILYAKEKNVGKTAALKFLSRVLGFGRKRHPLAVSGVSGRGCGTSATEILRKLQHSTFPVLCDDSSLSLDLLNLIVSLKDGFSQSSKTDGDRTPEGQLILTSNSVPRLDSRVSSRILVNFFKKKGLQVPRRQQRALQKLKGTRTSEKLACLIVSAGQGVGNAVDLIRNIETVVQFLMPNVMDRTIVDIAIQLFHCSKVMALFCYGSFGQVLKLFLDSQYRLANKYYSSENEKGITPNIELDGLSAELERELDRIQDSKEIMCVALPGVCNLLGERDVKFLSIPIQFVRERDTLDKKAIKRISENKFGQKSWGKMVYFKRETEDITYEMVKRRQPRNKTKGRRSFRILTGDLPHTLVVRIYYAAGIPDRIERITDFSDNNSESENLAETVWKDVEGTIRDIHKEVIERFGSNEEELSEINIFQPFNPFMYGAPERNPESDDDQLISEGDDVSDIEDVSDGDDTSESDDNGLQGSDSGSEHGAGGSEGGYRSESDDGRERESEKDDLVSNDLSPDRSDRICESPVLPFTGPSSKLPGLIDKMDLDADRAKGTIKKRENLGKTGFSPQLKTSRNEEIEIPVENGTRRKLFAGSREEEDKGEQENEGEKERRNEEDIEEKDEEKEEEAHCYCREVIPGAKMIGCDSGRKECPGYNKDTNESWFHWKYVGITEKAPNEEEWMCTACRLLCKPSRQHKATKRRGRPRKRKQAKGENV